MVVMAYALWRGFLFMDPWPIYAVIHRPICNCYVLMVPTKLH
jgi:hypothetical protein